jgi:hypothetical protein
MPYDDHVRRSEIEYLTAYEEWEGALSDEDRKTLKDAAAPDLDSHSRCPTGREGDVSDSGIASEWPDIASCIDSDGERLAEQFGLARSMGCRLSEEIEKRVADKTAGTEASLLARVASIFCESPNPKLAAVALSFCAGLNNVYCLGPSMRAYAKNNGVSVAAISKLAVRWIDELGLHNTRHLRNPELREIYREAQLKKHWRKRT